MEYWSLQPIHSCEQDLSVNFDTHEYYAHMPEQFKKKLNRNARYFILTAVGKFEQSSKKGYGHLGHLKSRFIVSELLDVKVVTGF